MNRIILLDCTDLSPSIKFFLWWNLYFIEAHYRFEFFVGSDEVQLGSGEKGKSHFFLPRLTSNLASTMSFLFPTAQTGHRRPQPFLEKGLGKILSYTPFNPQCNDGVRCVLHYAAYLMSRKSFLDQNTEVISSFLSFIIYTFVLMRIIIAHYQVIPSLSWCLLFQAINQTTINQWFFSEKIWFRGWWPMT